MTDTEARTYEAGFDACMAHIVAMPTIYLHCTKPGELDMCKPADQQEHYERCGWTCMPMIYRPSVMR